MLIKYNNSNIHALGHLGSDPKNLPMGPAKIEFLTPGWNEFNNDLWATYQKHPQILKMIEDGKIEFLEVEVGKGKTKKTIGTANEPLELKELPDTKAIEVIKGTLNKKMLERWKDEETRPKVRRALEDHYKSLTQEAKDAKATPVGG